MWLDRAYAPLYQYALNYNSPKSYARKCKKSRKFRERVTSHTRFERALAAEFATLTVLPPVKTSITRPLLHTGRRGPHVWAGLELRYAPVPSLPVCDGRL